MSNSMNSNGIDDGQKPEESDVANVPDRLKDTIIESDIIEIKVLTHNGEPTITVMRDEETDQMPSRDGQKALCNYYEGLAFDLLEISKANTGNERAYEFGNRVLKHTTRSETVSVQELFSMLWVEGVSEDEALAFTTFAQLYDEPDYPTDVDPFVALAVSDQYGSRGTARVVIDDLRDHPSPVEIETLRALAELNNLNFDVETAVRALQNVDVEDVPTAVEHLFILTRRDIPAEINVESPGENTDLHSGTPANNDIVIAKESETTTSEKSPEMAGESTDSTESTNSNIVEIDASDNAFEEIVTTLKRAETEEDGDWDTLWKIGAILREGKQVHDFSFSEMQEEADLSLSKSKTSRARKIAELFEYQEYPSNATIEGIYRLNLRFDNPAETKAAAFRCDGINRELTGTIPDLWDDAEMDSVATVVEGLAEDGTDNIVGTAQLLFALEDRDLPSPEAIQTVSDGDADLHQYVTDDSNETNDADEAVEKPEPDTESSEYTRSERDTDTSLETWISNEYGRLEAEFEGNNLAWKTGELIEDQADEHTYTEIGDPLPISKNAQHGCRSLYNVFEYGEYSNEWAASTVSRACNTFESDAAAQKALLRCKKADTYLTLDVVRAAKVLDSHTITAVASKITENSDSNLIERIRAVYCLTGHEIPNDATLEGAVEKPADAPNREPDNYTPDTTEPVVETTTETETGTQDNTEEHEETGTTTPARFEELVPDDAITNALQDAADTTYDAETRTVNAPVETQQTITEEFSPGLPSQSVIEYLSTFPGLTTAVTQTGYWGALLDHENIASDTVNPSPTHFTETTARNGISDATIHDVGTRTDTPLFLPYPDYDADIITSVLLTYAESGGDTVLYLGEFPGGAHSERMETFVSVLTEHFTYVTSIETVQWENQNDALHVFTRSGNAPQTN